MEIRILFEDEQIIVCEKPAGVAVQTKRLGQADMESLLKNRRAGKGELPYIGVVHRLDQPVSGVMVFAKTKEAAAALSRQIASGLADKFYYAVTSRCIPFHDQEQISGTCVCCGRPAHKLVYWGKAY